LPAKKHYKKSCSFHLGKMSNHAYFDTNCDGIVTAEDCILYLKPLLRTFFSIL